ncbi:MAG: right-handed parallel beta-helix repeat-containing protein, partial [Candidatus Nanoarchaeia archaeon]
MGGEHKQSADSTRLFYALGLSLFFILILSSNLVLAEDVDSCRDLNVSGTTYTLNQSVNISGATCFNITAANITIDCSSFSITGNSGDNTYGVYTDQFNSTIDNCNILSFGTGIFFEGATNGTISNTNVSISKSVSGNNGYALYLKNNANYNQILTNRLTTSNSGWAVYLNTVSNNTLLSTVTEGGRGIFIQTSSNNQLLNINSTSASSTGYSIFLDSDSNYNLLSNILANTTGTGARSISLQSGTRNNFTNITINSNYQALFMSSSTYNILYNISIITTAYGLSIVSSSSNTISEINLNTTAGGGNSISISGGSSNTLSNITAANTNETALKLSSSADSNIFRNITLTSSNKTAILLNISSDSNSNTFCLNNFTETNNYYVYDLNGSNYYNCTYDGLNQGNIWHNVMNGSVNIYGTASSSVTGLYLGTNGTGYPYNSSNSQNKTYGNVIDYTPLTATYNYTAPAATANLTVICGTGGASCTGNSTDFELPANKTITATADTNYEFSNWTVTSGNCTINNATSNNTYAIFLNDTTNCEVTANFVFNSTTPQTYYVDSTLGNDSNQGITEETAWKTLDKVSSTNFNPGDIILLKRGETWNNQTLSLSTSNILIDAYGAGNNPIIDGSFPITNWTLYSGSIYTTNIGSGRSIYALFINQNIRQTDAHYPNTGYLYPSSTSTTLYSFTDTDLSLTLSQINGSKIALRDDPWQQIVRTVSNYNAGTHLVTFTPDAESEMQSDSGYILSDMLWMIDSPGEWWYNSSSGDIYLWASDSSNVSNTDVTATENFDAVIISNATGITISNITVMKTAKNGIYLENVNNSLITAANISYIQTYGIYLNNSNSCNITNSDVMNSHHYGIQIIGSNNTIQNNTIYNTGNIMLYRQNVDQPYGIRTTVYGVNNSIINNTITHMGYGAIKIGGNYSLISGNLIDDACTFLVDCGAIYTNYDQNYNTYESNIIMNVIQNLTGSNTQTSTSYGIYFDRDKGSTYDDSGNNLAQNNIFINCSGGGIFVHVEGNITMKNNIIYGGVYGIRLEDKTVHEVENNTATNNTIFTINNTGFNIYMRSDEDINITKMGNFTGNNYFAFPNTSVARVKQWADTGSEIDTNYTYSEWLTTGEDSG